MTEKFKEGKIYEKEPYPVVDDIDINTLDINDKTAIPADIDPNTPTEQVIAGYDRLDSIIWEAPTEYGREFLTYRGTWYVEFLKPYRNESIAFRDAKVKAGITEFKSVERKSRYLFIFSDSLSQEEIKKRGLDIAELRGSYNTSEEITPYFTDMDRDVNPEYEKYLLTNTLEDLLTSESIKHDLQYFTKDPSNYADYYFGATTNHDIGFYRDKGKRIRASYDPYYTFRAGPIMQDLLAYGKPEQYVVARFPSGLIQFVIDQDLSDALVKVYGSEDKLAKRWNDVRTVYTEGFTFEIPVGFEEVLDISTEEYVNAKPLFGFEVSDETPKE